MKKITLAQAYEKQFGKVSFPFEVYDANGNETYFEDSSGYWLKREYDANGNETCHEDSDGFWCKSEYDANGNEIYDEDSDGFWGKYEYDSNGNWTYSEYSDGNTYGKKARRIDNCETINLKGAIHGS